METRRSDRLDKILQGMEFPGEDEEAVRATLARSRLADRVMARTVRDLRATRRSVFWAAFAALNLLLLALTGSNSYIHSEFFYQQDGLNQFFFIFLGLTLLGGVGGLIFSLDTSWLDRLLHHDA
jgi:hypothetical protein